MRDMVNKGVGRRAALTVTERRRVRMRQSLEREEIMMLVVVCGCERVSGASEEGDFYFDDFFFEEKIDRFRGMRCNLPFCSRSVGRWMVID